MITPLTPGNGWEVVDGHHIVKTFEFPDFVKALEFVNRVGEIAEEQNHHPAVYLAWGRVRVASWSHDVDGLTERDYALAMSVDEAYSEE